MQSTSLSKLSEHGTKFLSNPIMHAALLEICTPIGVKPEEFLIEFEKMLSISPKAIFEIFEGNTSPPIIPFITTKTKVKSDLTLVLLILCRKKVRK